METRKELFEYIFDILEDLELVKWTKMYTREVLTEAFSQTKKVPYIFCEKDASNFSASLRRIFNSHKEFTNYKGVSESWQTFLLRLINYKKCYECEKTKLIEEFNNNKATAFNVGCICKQCLSIKSKETREINKNYIVKELGGYCIECGYKENNAALEIHHKDKHKKRPDYSINKYGDNKSPSVYMINVSYNLMKVRFKTEQDNIELLCRNCHQKEPNINIYDSQKGLKAVLVELKYTYICEVENCNENINLHLHHNNPKEKTVAFGYFQNQSKKRILSEGLLEKEMNKDVSILCGNHHREYHNPIWKIIEE